MSPRRIGQVIGWVLVVAGLLMMARQYALIDRVTVWPDIDRVWTESPPYSAASFWKFQHLITTLSVDDRFRGIVTHVLPDTADDLLADAVEYQAIPLEQFLPERFDALPADYTLIATNLRKERVYLSSQDIAREQPVIVIGIGAVKELFSHFLKYRMRRENTWTEQDGTPPWMVRPLGAFIHFPKDPAEHLKVDVYSQYGMTTDSFVVTAVDPFASIRDMDPEIVDLLAGSTVGCLVCHSYRGIGESAHHTTGLSGQGHGGYALDLASYPRDVMRRFLYNQETVAAEMGVTPFPPFAKDLAEKLLDSIY